MTSPAIQGLHKGYFGIAGYSWDGGAAACVSLLNRYYQYDLNETTLPTWAITLQGSIFLYIFSIQHVVGSLFYWVGWE